MATRAPIYQKRLADVGARLSRRIDQAVVNLALDLTQRLLRTTPVDVGVAISNWTLTLGAAAKDYEPAYSPGSHGSTHGQNISSAYAQAASAISDRRSGQTIFISNNAPYILALNRGTSTQAPTGFIQTQILEVVANFRIPPPGRSNGNRTR